MLSADTLLKLAAALLTTVFATMLALASPRDRTVRWLVVFLGLIALNQSAETLRSFTAPEDALLWFRVATVAASLDPLALLLFVAAAAGIELRWRTLALLGLPGAGLALAAGWLASPSVMQFLGAFLVLYTLATYWVALSLVLGRFRHSPGDGLWRALVPAVMVAALPVVPRVIEAISYAWELSLGIRPYMIASALLCIAAAAVALWQGSPRNGTRDRAPLWIGLGLAAAITLMAKSFEALAAILNVSPATLPPSLQTPGRASASIRWLAFGVLVSAALFRERALVASLAARRRSARGLVALWLLLGAFLAAVAASEWGGAGGPLVNWVEVAILLVAVGMSTAFGKLVDKVAARVYGVPDLANVEAIHDVYRRAVGEALAEGRAVHEDEGLRRLREELGLSPATARALERIPASAHAPLRLDVLVAGRYRVEAYLGRGGGGRAFLARDELLYRRVVLKEVAPAQPGAGIREARAASHVRHPGIVAVYDAIQRDENLLLVLEHVEGGTLADRVGRDGPLRGREAVETATAILEAVAALHAARLVHADLKPENVLLTPDGRPKVTDFGLARSRSTTVLSGPPSSGGTPGYVAPEVLRGEPPDARADVYALGHLLARCFDAPELAPIADRAGAPDAAVRWENAAAMLDAAVEATSSTRAGSGPRR